MILSHGMIGWHRKPKFAVFAEKLTPWFAVYAMDMRGHGESTGVCDFGGLEIYDIEAVHQRARADGHDRIITVGTSMGGIATIRHGALIGGVDAVIGISSLAYWDWHDDAHPKLRRNMHTKIGTPAGRAACAPSVSACPSTGTNPNRPKR